MLLISSTARRTKTMRKAVGSVSIACSSLRHLTTREIFKCRRSAALVEWRVLIA